MSDFRLKTKFYVSAKYSMNIVNQRVTLADSLFRESLKENFVVTEFLVFDFELFIGEQRKEEKS